jgi:ATPase subunit of ABC transporter with duplicated ATPase domains
MSWHAHPCDGPRILIVGANDCGKKTLLSRIIEQPEPFTAPRCTLHPWTLDTKYYTASVHIQLARLADVSGENAAKYEAVVLVLDASQESSFTLLRDWAAAADTSSAEIRQDMACHFALFDGRCCS